MLAIVRAIVVALLFGLPFSAVADDLRNEFQKAAKDGKGFAKSADLNQIAQQVCYDSGSYDLHPGESLQDLTIVLLFILEEAPPGVYVDGTPSCLSLDAHGTCSREGPRICTSWSKTCVRSVRVCSKRSWSGKCRDHTSHCLAWKSDCSGYSRPCLEWLPKCSLEADTGAMFATIGAGADAFIDGTPPNVPACMIKQHVWDFKFVSWEVDTKIAADAFKTSVEDAIAAGKGDYTKLMDGLKVAFSGIVFKVTASQLPSPDLVASFVQWGSDALIAAIKNATKAYETELEAAAAAG